MTEASRADGSSVRRAAIDIGTNSVLLLVVEGVGHDLHSIVDHAVITRLGRGVDQTGRLEAEASSRTLACLRTYADELDRLQVSSRQAVGTSALRDASGGDEFLDQAERVLGTRPRVLSGREEAELSFGGALSGLNLAGSATVFDVGGGSTEFIAGHAMAESQSIASATSVNVGAVRMHERHIKHDPALPEELKGVRQDVRSRLPESTPYSGAANVIGVAGTVTTLLAISKQMATYDGSQVHGQRLSRTEVDRLYQALAQLSVAERSKIAGLEPRRADVIVAGALIVLESMDWLQARSIIVSDRGLRWGLVARFTE